VVRKISEPEVTTMTDRIYEIQVEFADLDELGDLQRL